MKLSPSEIHAELERVRSSNYSQYVKSVRLKNVRGFKDERVTFNYPVTALIGTNGGGKSTILGAAALSYITVKPGQFFPKAFLGDDTMANWVVDVELIDKGLSATKAVEKTARFSNVKWRRDGFPRRQVEYIEIQRTVPAGELTRFRKFINGDKNEYQIMQLNPDTIKYAGAVLDKDVSNYRVVCNKTKSNEKMYVGAVADGTAYSQFHFGAGEASVIETIDRIENAKSNALVLMEEIENGLHPVAVRLFVQYLMRASQRKRLQVLFTTHSQDAVNELPSEAVWASINKHTFNGKLSIESLRAITGVVPDERAVFVEDEFVQEWTKNAIGRYGGKMAATTKVYPAGGYPNVVKVSKYHNENPSIKIPSVALVDGDIYKGNPDELPKFAKYLGDGKPEQVIFDYIFENRHSLISKIRERCYLSHFSVDEIIVALESVSNSACDSHIIFSELSSRLDFTSEIYIRAGMIDLFNEGNEGLWRPIVDFIKESQKAQ